MSKLTRALPAILVAAALAAITAPRAAASPIATIPGSEPAAPATTPSAPAAPAAPAAAPAPAAANDAPRFELLDRGDTVEIIAHNIKAARTAILPVRSRLEVPLAGAPQAKRVTPVDHTVKLIELAEESTPVLSVKLAFERADVKALSRFAQAIQVGDDLHLLVPRKLPEGDVAPRLPDPTLPPALAARIGAQPGSISEPKLEARSAAPTTPAAPVATAPAAAPPAATPPAAPAAAAPVLGPKLDPHPAAPMLGPKPDPAAPPTTAATIHDAGAAATGRPRSAADAIAAGNAPSAGSPAAAPTEARPLRPELASEHDDAWSRISMLLALGLAATGGGIWLMRKRRGRPGTASSIEVIAQRSLGGKARIVWLSVGQHEMVVSVTAQQVRMLSQWRKTDAPAVLPHATSFADELRSNTQTLPRTITAPIPTMSDKPMSPAVSGLIRLRRTSQMAAVAVEPPDDDPPADDVWAREILAATGTRPGVRR